MANNSTKRTFYRPHARVQFMNELTNPHTGEVTRPESMTKQSFLEECNINNIIKQFSVTGMFSHVSSKAGQGAYENLPDSVDFQEAMQTQIVAEQAFMSLPARLRDRFGNDPAQFLGFLHDEANEKEARELGLLNPLPPDPVVPAAPPQAAPGGPAPASGAPQNPPSPAKA